MFVKENPNKKTVIKNNNEAYNESSKPDLESDK